MSHFTSHSSLDRNFARMPARASNVAIWWLTRGLRGVFHRFHHTCPISPSGRFLALTRMADESRRPEPGEGAGIVILDLHTGETRQVWESFGWDTQLGAQAQWGADDSELFFNDMDTDSWEPFAIRLNPATGEAKHLGHTIYSISRDGRFGVSCCLKRIARTQKGYGVVVPDDALPVNSGASADDGIYVVDTRTGVSTRIVSHRTIASQLGLKIGGDQGLYGFHCLWNLQGDRIMVVLRMAPSLSKRTAALITMRPDGADIRMAISPDQWAWGGNHPTWCPDGEHLLMNLKLDGRQLQFVKVRHDGRDLHAMTGIEATRGHPSLLPDNRHIVTDNTLKEARQAGSNRTQIRLVNIARNSMSIIDDVDVLAERFSGNDGDLHNSLRIDPHPAVVPEYPNLIVYNGTVDGSRAVFLADTSELLN